MTIEVNQGFSALEKQLNANKLQSHAADVTQVPKPAVSYRNLADSAASCNGKETRKDFTQAVQSPSSKPFNSESVSVAFQLEREANQVV